MGKGAKGQRGPGATASSMNASPGRVAADTKPSSALRHLAASALRANPRADPYLHSLGLGARLPPLPDCTGGHHGSIAGPLDHKDG